MPTEVVMPQMGESITEGTLTKWLKKPGDTVARDEPLFEISTDKVDAEIPSPAAGTLGEIKIQEGATVSINTVVCTINEEGAAAASSGPAPPKQEAATSAATNDAPAPAAPATPAAEAGPGTEVMMPQMGESITEGTITKWLKKVGDTVARDEPIFEISTDKVDAEIPSPVAGTLTEIKVQEGATVTVNTVVAVIGGGGAAAPQAAAPAAAPTPAAGTRASHPRLRRHQPPHPQLRSKASALLAAGTQDRQRQQRRSLDRAPPPAPPAASPSRTSSAISEGRATTGRPSLPAAAAAAAPAAPPAAPAKPAAPQPQPGELVPMTKMRATSSPRSAWSSPNRLPAHVHTVRLQGGQATRIVKLREKEKNKYEQRNSVKLTYMPFITRAAVQALRKHPIVNSTTQGDAILYNKNINIGIAVALDWGLIVPVIKQAEEKSFLGVARAIVDLANRARTKKLAPDEVAGGTFTLTNSGIFGEQFGTPIIAQPQSAILGIGGLNKEAEVLTDKDGNDSIAIRSIQRFTLGFDHRTIDGSDAGKFMSDFKAYLENWSEDIG